MIYTIKQNNTVGVVINSSTQIREFYYVIIIIRWGGGGGGGGVLRVTTVDNSQLGNNATTRVISMLYNHSLA